MVNFSTKEEVLKISIFGVLSLLSTLAVVYFLDSTESICPYETTLSCFLTSLALELFIFAPVLVFSLLTYKTKEEVFISWRKFTFIYLFIYLFLELVSPWEHAVLIGFDKKSSLFFLCSIYTIISLALIAYKSYRLRGKK